MRPGLLTRALLASCVVALAAPTYAQDVDNSKNVDSSKDVVGLTDDGGDPEDAQALAADDAESRASDNTEELTETPGEVGPSEVESPQSGGQATPDGKEKGGAQTTAVVQGPRPKGNALLSPSVRLHGLLAGAKAISGHQSREYGFGGGALVAAEWGPSALWGVQAELGFLGLGARSRTAPNGLAELGAATGTHMALGLRARPFAASKLLPDPKSPWISAAIGASLTGGTVAPILDVFAGYDFSLSEGIGLGPQIGYVLVLQTDKDAVRPDNANLFLAGVHGTFDFGPPPAPVKDTDKDGFLDPDDSCPLKPEDRDGFEDEDGCPDLDNDDDGINDVEDRCPLVPEDADEFEDDDGCPDPDNDRDEVLDVDDKCPLEPEDIDEFEDADGCPDPDNDQDKIMDLKDLCPNEPEIINGIADNDGCPDAESIRVVGDKIELDQKIHFWTNSDRIRAMSYPVLDKLARFLKEHPEYIHIDVEGHADSRGNEEFNLDLSKRRANSIAEFLAKRGVGESRLSSEGFGSSRPLMEGKTEHAWFMNRRVEFVVTRNREVKVDPTTGKAIEKAPAFGRDSEEQAP